MRILFQPRLASHTKLRCVVFLFTTLGLLAYGTLCAAQVKQRPIGIAPVVGSEGVRTRVSLDKDWKFLDADATGAEQPGFRDARWKKVDVPHTWNAADTQDDVPGYRMGIGWYRKLIKLSGQFKGKRLFLYFEGANQVAEVFVNGKFVGRHQGGYTAFVFDVTSFVTLDSANNENIIAVKVDNSSNENIPPSPTADFNLYGGIYRDVWLVATDSVHFTMLDYASAGVYVDTPEVSAESATARTRGQITNNGRQTRRLRVVNTVLDGIGESMAVGESRLSVEGGAEAAFQQGDLVIRKPHLWSPETPYLYSLRTQLFDGEKLLDQITNPLGFRWFSFHPDLGFFLNGNVYKLRGANRHQDYFGLGNAVSNEIQVRDLALLKELGLNCVLLAHYPQDPAVLEAADQMGLLVWEELPIVREISTSNEFASNCQVMLTEMIRQHHNHPSIIMWCLMNEVFLKLRTEAGYVRRVVALAHALDELARKEDPTRVTVISANRPYDDSDIYNASGLLSIPQVVGWHMYFGWYYDDFEGLGKFLDAEHQRFPRRVLFVSEYGADSDARLHSLEPLRGDLSSEWAQLYHESYLPQLEARSYLAGSAIWAQNDFGSEARGESFPHINTKGLFTFDRRRKDIYYFYKASLSSVPVLHIVTQDWRSRTGANVGELAPDRSQFVVQSVKVYTNLREVELFANKKSLGIKSVGPARIVSWQVPFADGLNVLQASGRVGGQELSDRAEVRFSYRSSALADPLVSFRELAVNVGSTSQFIDPVGLVWEADQPYAPPGWGCTGGVPVSTNRNILGTTDDPLFQTARQGLTACRFDVPDGRYEVEMYFAEYLFQQPGERVFSVSINEKKVIADLDLVKAGGASRAEKRVFPVNATESQGVNIQFTARRGDTVLSAIRLRKLR